MHTGITPQILLLLAPIVLLQLILMIVALVDLARREKVRWAKWIWALIIIFGELIGPILYFLIGRREE